MLQQTHHTTITLRGREVNSIFDLLGSNENDITYSIGWVMSRSPSFLNAIVEKTGLSSIALDEILLQN